VISLMAVKSGYANINEVTDERGMRVF
jgi:hypothetical protein